MLTDRAIRQAKAKDKKYKLHDYGGLFLIVNPSRKDPRKPSKLWRFRYTKNKITKEMALGSYPAAPLAEAREKVARYRACLAKGLDPMREATLERSRENERFLFASVAHEFMKNTKRDICDKHRNNLIARLNTYILPYIGDLDIRDLRTCDILNMLNQIAETGYADTAIRVRGMVGGIFRYGVLAGFCDFDITEPLKGYIKKPPTRHYHTLTDPDEIAALLRDIWGYAGQQHTRMALRLSAYTFCRPQEIRQAEWAEIDFDKAVWTIPGEKMKMRRAHVVPLAQQVLAVFNAMKPYTQDKRYVFAKRGETCLSTQAVNTVLRKLGYRNKIVAHGFRAMASTILHEQGYNPLHIEMQLAHAEKNQVKAAYNHAEYLDARRQMMIDYADYLDRLRCG